MHEKTITLALTGASGMPYALRLLECLLHADVRVYLLYTQVAQIVLHQEAGLSLPGRATEARTFLNKLFGINTKRLQVFSRDDWFAPIASGSSAPDAMVICPCTMGTLGSIASGLSDNLIQRAADVVLKEGRKLILVPRETPVSMIHLENMLRLAKSGAIILPPNPGFYHHPQSIQDLVDFVVARILDHLDVPHQLGKRWGDIKGPRSDQNEVME